MNVSIYKPYLWWFNIPQDIPLKIDAQLEEKLLVTEPASHTTPAFLRNPCARASSAPPPRLLRTEPRVALPVVIPFLHAWMDYADRGSTRSKGDPGDVVCFETNSMTEPHDVGSMSVVHEC